MRLGSGNVERAACSLNHHTPVQGVTAKNQAARSGTQYQHPYDLGILRNVHAILGPNATNWCLCTSSAHGDGLSYTTIWDAPLPNDADKLLSLT